MCVCINQTLFRIVKEVSSVYEYQRKKERKKEKKKAERGRRKRDQRKNEWFVVGIAHLILFIYLSIFEFFLILFHVGRAFGREEKKYT